MAKPEFKCAECGKPIKDEGDLVVTLLLLPPKGVVYHAKCYVGLLKSKLMFAGATPMNSKTATVTAVVAGIAAFVVAFAAFLLKQPILVVVLLFLGLLMLYARYYVYDKFEKPWNK
jgi:hypothetical protein